MRCRYSCADSSLLCSLREFGERVTAYGLASFALDFRALLPSLAVLALGIRCSLWHGVSFLPFGVSDSATFIKANL